MPTRLCAVFVLGLMITFAGCGDNRPERVPVSGQVLIDGKPLEHGFIQIIPEGHRAATGDLGPDGRFQLYTFDREQFDGCVPGKHKVRVVGLEETGPHSRRWHAPKEYMDPEKNDLTVEVTEPTDDLKIEISWKGGKPFDEKDSDTKE